MKCKSTLRGQKTRKELHKYSLFSIFLTQLNGTSERQITSHILHIVHDMIWCQHTSCTICLRGLGVKILDHLHSKLCVKLLYLCTSHIILSFPHCVGFKLDSLLSRWPSYSTGTRTVHLSNLNVLLVTVSAPQTSMSFQRRQRV